MPLNSMWSFYNNYTYTDTGPLGGCKRHNCTFKAKKYEHLNHLYNFELLFVFYNAIKSSQPSRTINYCYCRY